MRCFNSTTSTLCYFLSLKLLYFSTELGVLLNASFSNRKSSPIELSSSLKHSDNEFHASSELLLFLFGFYFFYSQRGGCHFFIISSQIFYSVVPAFCGCVLKYFFPKLLLPCLGITFRDNLNAYINTQILNSSIYTLFLHIKCLTQNAKIKPVKIFSPVFRPFLSAFFGGTKNATCYQYNVMRTKKVKLV